MWCGIRVGRISLLCLVCSTVALSQTTARPDFGHGTYWRSWAYRTTPHLAHYSWTSEMEEPCFRILIAFADLSSKLTSLLWSFNRGPAKSANSESLSSMIALRPSLRLTWAWHTGPLAPTACAGMGSNTEIQIASEERPTPFVGRSRVRIQVRISGKALSRRAATCLSFTITAGLIARSREKNS